MGGKKQPRTKNNVQPSSSDRHAQRLGAEPLIGFSALSDLGYVPAAVGGVPDDAATGGVAVSGQLRALLKKMDKKDAITKSKAVQEFAELCGTHDLDDLKAALPFWPRLYRKLATDVDNRVRELSHVALQRLLSRVRRAAAPLLIQLVPTWLSSQGDPYPPAASAAKRAFQSTFPEPEKRTGVVQFCQAGILSHISEGLYDLSPQTYSDSSVMSSDELESRYVRLLTGCLSALCVLIELLDEPSPSSAPAAVPEQALDNIVTNNKFCKLVKHGHPQVRRWWFSLVSRLCARRPRLVLLSAARLAPAALHGLHEQEPAVITDAWDAAISLASTVPDCWSHVNLRKAVLPQLWSALREGGRGCAVTLHPLMIILLSKLPADVAGEQQAEFHRLFFSSLYQGLSVDRVLQSRREVSVICRTLWECALYVLRSPQCSQQVVDVIVEQLSALSSGVVSGPLVRVGPSVLPPLAAGLNSLYSLAAADGGGPAAAAQQLYWAALESAVLRQHLSSEEGPAAAASVDLLLAATGAGGQQQPTADGRARVTFGDPAPSAAAAAAERLSPLALAADSPLRQCAARAGQLLMDSVRAASGGLERRRQLVRLLVGVPGVAEQLMSAGGRQLYDVLMEPELAAGGWQLSSQLLPTVWRLCEPEQRDQLAHHVTQRGYLSVASELLQLSAADGQLRDWAGSEQLLAAVRTALCSATSDASHCWRQALRTVPPLLERAHADRPNADPAAELLTAVAVSPAAGWRLELLAPLLAPSCRSQEALLAAHGAALAGGGSAALAALQGRLAALGGQAADGALARQLRTALAAGPAPAARHWLLDTTLCWARLLGGDRFCPLLEALLPAGWQEDSRRPQAQLCLLLRRGVSLRLPAAAAGPACDGAADHLRRLLARLLTERPAGEAERSAAARYLPHLLADHVVTEAAGELSGRTDGAGLQTAEGQLSRLVASLSEEQRADLQRTVLQRASAAEDGVDAAGLAVLLRISEVDSSSLPDIIQNNIQLLLPCVPLLPDAALVRLVSAGPELELERLAGAAAALGQLSARHGRQWTVAEAGSGVVAALDAVVAARDTGQLPCGWQEAGADRQRLAHSLSVLHFFTAVLDHCSCLLEPTHWDMLLLAVSSWLADIQWSEVGPGQDGAGLVLLHALCRVVEAVRQAVARPCHQSGPLASEWSDLYAPEWYRALLGVLVTLATGEAAGPSVSPLMSEAVTALSGAVLHAPAAALLQESALPACRAGPLQEAHLSTELVTLLGWWRRLLTVHCRPVRLAAWHTLHRLLPQLAAAEQSRPHEQEDGDEPRLALPTLFTLITGQTEPLVSALLSELSPGQTCLVDPGRESHHVVLTHLMTWHLVLSFTGHQDMQRKVMTAETLRQDGTLDVLLNQLFCLMPETPEVPESYADTDKTFFELEPPLNVTGGGGGSAEEVQHWACRTYAELLRQLPVLTRAWRSSCERPLALRVERLTSEHVSPLLLREEFSRLQAAGHADTDNMTVRARPSVREVSAVYTMEEASTELVVRLPADYPLGHVVADAAGRRVGVAAGQWRMWMLQLTTFLTHQNGSVLDGLLLWKQNIDKRFQGVEECNICFYILHGTNYQLPKLACRNCKKRFHPACLYKWFSTSSKSTCPMCRQLF